jgi:hypothetical protein
MKNQKPKSQKEQVLFHLQKRSLSMPQAVSMYNIYRLASVICQLKKEGHKIKSISIPFISKFGNSSSYSKYVLI